MLFKTPKRTHPKQLGQKPSQIHQKNNKNKNKGNQKQIYIYIYIKREREGERERERETSWVAEFEDY